MDASTNDLQAAKASDVSVSDDRLTVDLADGRRLSVPLTWYPRLLHGTPEERRNWRLIDDGIGIHWPALDEDIKTEGLLTGKRSGESERSLQQWLSLKQRATKTYEFPMPRVTTYLECQVDRERETCEEIPHHEVRIDVNRMQAGQFAPIARGGAKLTYGSKIVPLDFVRVSNPSDEYFIAALPEKKFDVFLNNNSREVREAIMDEQGNPKKMVCYAWYCSGQAHHAGWPTDPKMAFFVSDSPNHVPVGDLLGGAQAFLRETGVLSIRGHVLVPCKVKGYNAKVLNPCKALKRWYKRNALEANGPASLGEQLRLIGDKFALATESREFINFAALDLGGGPLANTWILAVAEAKLPPASIHVLDIDHRALLAGASVYGPDLAKVEFHWEERAKQGSAYQTGYPDGKFDFVMAINSIENIVNAIRTGVEEHRDYQLIEDEREGAGRDLFGELDRILKPKGRLYLSTFSGDNKSDAYPYCFTDGELASFAKGTKLRVVAISKPYSWKHDNGKSSKMLSAVFEKDSPASDTRSQAA